MLSSKFTIYSTGWLELIFAGRNQTYGAYELRKNYPVRLCQALLLASAVFIALALIPLAIQQWKQGQIHSESGRSLADKDEPVFRISEYSPPAPKKAPAEPTQPSAKPMKVKSLKFIQPRVVPLAQLHEEDIPSMGDIEKAVISSINQEGQGGTANVPASLSGEGAGNGWGTGSEAGNESLETAGTVERQPEFPGGFEAFSDYLRQNLRYPVPASENGISGRVFIHFIVEKDGSLSDIRVVKGIGFGCDEEAVRVLKKSPHWQPGEQNGRKVRVMYTIPIVFSLGG